jgi:hypothetical protein
VFLAAGEATARFFADLADGNLEKLHQPIREAQYWLGQVVSAAWWGLIVELGEHPGRFLTQHEIESHLPESKP